MRHVQQANSALYFQYNTQLGPPYQILVDTNFINFSIQNKLELNKVRVYSFLVRDFLLVPFTRVNKGKSKAGQSRAGSLLSKEERRAFEAPLKKTGILANITLHPLPFLSPASRFLLPHAISLSLSLSVGPQAMMDCLYAKCIPCITDCVMAELEKLGRKYRLAMKIAKDPRIKRLTCQHKGTYADDCLVNRCTEHRCFIVATCDRDLKRRIRKIPGVPIMFIQARKYSIERMPDAFGAPR